MCIRDRIQTKYHKALFHRLKWFYVENDEVICTMQSTSHISLVSDESLKNLPCQPHTECSRRASPRNDDNDNHLCLGISHFHRNISSSRYLCTWQPQFGRRSETVEVRGCGDNPSSSSSFYLIPGPFKGELSSFSIMNMVKVLEKCRRTKKNRTLKAAFLRFWRFFFSFRAK